MSYILIIFLSAVIVACLYVIRQKQEALESERKLTKNVALEQGHKKFEALIENGLDAVIIFTPEGKTSYISKSITNILGYSQEEALKIDIWKIIHPEDVAPSQMVLAQCLEKPGIPIKGHKSRLKHKNGTWRWVEPVVNNLLHDPAVQGIVDNFRDITEFVEAEAALQKINERFQLATKSSKLGIWDHCLIDDSIVWDLAMFTIYAIPNEFEISTNSWLSMVHPDDQGHWKKAMQAMRNSGEDLDIDFRILKPDSSVGYIRSLAQVQKNEQGQAVRLIGTNLDITPSKEYEKTLEQILFDISHIIRKPVTNILGMSELLDEKTLDQKELSKVAVYLNEAAKELDDFTKRLNDSYLEKKNYLENYTTRKS